MSFFKDLFARGPRLPEPVFDPYDGDEAARAAADALRRGDWKPAAALLGPARSDDRAFLAGSFAEVGHRKPVDLWLAARPSDPGAWVVRGLLRIGEAWAIRGSGRASEVDDDAWPRFRAGLEEAEGDLREAIRLDGDDPTPWGYLLITGRGLDLEVPELRERLDEARRRDPRGWLAPYMALDAFTEKWSGSHEVMFAFVRELSAGEPDGSALHALVAQAHIERWLYFTMQDPPDPKSQERYFGRRDVQDEIRRAWERGTGSAAFRPGRFAKGQLNRFAFTFYMGGDMGRAQEVFRRIGSAASESPWSYLGDPADAFVRARAEALGS